MTAPAQDAPPASPGAENVRRANAGTGPGADPLPADGVRTGVGRINGRPVAVIAHDFAVKAGSWGRLTCEKQVRILERADRDLLPVVYLVDSAGGRLTEQLGFFSDRRGASRIFQLQVALSGRVPQICCLHGPSAAGGAYMPAFTDWVGMVEGHASMYLASPRVAEKVTGERTTLEEMGGAVMHATVSGCADEVFGSDWEVITAARLLLSYLPDHWEQRPPKAAPSAPATADWSGVIPATESEGYDVRDVIDGLVDASSFFEIKARSWPGWPAWTAGWWVWWPTSPRSAAARSSWIRRTRRPGSSPCATPSTCR